MNEPKLPETMQAIAMAGYGEPDVLQLQTVPLPPMRRDNDVMVEVHAAGVNPFEAKLRRGWLRMLYTLEPGTILGKDVAGVVAAAGFDVHEFAPGDRVWGLIDTMRPGAYAEYTAVTAYALRKMPANLSFEQAAAVPLAGCTAWFAMVEMANVQPGQRVLIHAGAGGVGSFAIQIAKYLGAWVATTCSAGNADYVRSLGADEVIDYAAEDFRTRLSDIDVVLDTIGRETNHRSYEVMRRGGTLLSVLRGDPMEIENRERLMAQYGVTTKVVVFSMQPDILDKLAALFESGALQVPALTVLPLAQAAEAHRQIDTGHTRGKIVLKVR